MSILKWAEKLRKKLHPAVGRTLIAFRDTGCMGEIENYEFSAVITLVKIRDGLEYYHVKQIHPGDASLIRIVPSWYCHRIGEIYFYHY